MTQCILTNLIIQCSFTVSLIARGTTFTVHLNKVQQGCIDNGNLVVVSLKSEKKIFTLFFRRKIGKVYLPDDQLYGEIKYVKSDN